MSIGNLINSNTNYWLIISSNDFYKTFYINRIYNDFKEKEDFFAKKILQDDIEKNIFPEIDNYYENYTPISDDLSIQYTDNSIILKDIIIKVNPEILKSIKQHSNSNVITMIYRYSSMLLGGQQWGIPFKHYDKLYNNYDVRYEGFTSPLNSRIIRYTNGKFCSLFYDVDKPFGSIGNFFDIDMLKHNNTGWCINPPYIDELLIKSAKKCIESIIKARELKINLFIFFIMPGWFDSIAYEILSTFQFKKYEEILLENSYFYEYKNKKIKASFKSVTFVLDSSDKLRNYSDINQYMKF